MSKVGPGRRPKSTGFRKGVSGNPAGRPRKERPADPTSAFDVVIDKTLMIEQDGKSREVTIEEALWHKTYQNAIAGDRSAQREVLKMIDKLQWPESYQRRELSTFVGPLSRSDGHDCFGLVHELVPGLAPGLNDGVVIFEDAVREPVLSEVLPDVLDRV